jgi:hypothetical protein
LHSCAVFRYDEPVHKGKMAMDKAKRMPDATGKKKERTAPIEFVAPYSLPDCLYRIRDTKSLDTGFISPGIDPSFEKVESGVYRIKIRRTWYDNRYRRHYSMVELNGYLKGIDETSTAVIADVRTSLRAILVMVALVALVIIEGLMIPKAQSAIVFLVFGAIILVIYGLWLVWDRRTLKYVLHHAMSDEF